MISNNIRVDIYGSQSSKPIIVKLTLEDNLSVIRENLKNNDTIKMNDTLLFSKKFADNKLTEISHENEKDFILKDIIEVSNDSYTLYLKETSRPYWKLLNDLHRLDFGCTMTSDGIKRAYQRAFITEECQLNEINNKKNDEVKFNSREDRMIKKNLFFTLDINMNVKYFAKIGIKYENEYYNDIEDNTYKYQVYEKASFKIDKLKATDDFIKRVSDALKSGNRKKFVQITEEFGQFIPTGIILGKRFPIDDQTKDEEDLLNDYRNWDIIGLLEPISIFELLDDDLRKELYSFFRKRILYSKITTVPFNDNDDEDNRTKIVELPQRISKIISNKHADCSIFATVVGMKDYYHCQILTDKEELKLIVHYFKEKSKIKDSEFTIGWMVVGYDTNFRSIFPDYNPRSFNDTQINVKVLNIDNDSPVDLKSSTEKPHYIGIPYTKDESDPMIGHYFSNDRNKLYTFAHSPKDKQYPKFSLHLIEMINSSAIFEKYFNSSINLDNIDEFKNFTNIPKFLTLCLRKDESRSILLKQHPTKIKVKFFDNKLSFNTMVIRKLSNDDLQCLFFVPFESDKPRSNSNSKSQIFFLNNINNAKASSKMSFSEFSSLLEKAIELLENIVELCQPAKNNEKILEKFENKASEAIKVLKNLRNYRDYFYNQDDTTLLEKLTNDIKDIKNFVEKILNKSKFKNIFVTKNFEKSFYNDLANIERSIESLIEREFNRRSVVFSEPEEISYGSREIRGIPQQPKTFSKRGTNYSEIATITMKTENQRPEPITMKTENQQPESITMKMDNQQPEFQ
ncbi:hypothetical protein RclHR1_01200003 [Rhizophagus clarus]|uniref:DUF7431 domain-containing protein n=1 Tax=Rhizophagus clarus TaxID=94130 RepID=A0A2Z6QI72_9GLOM|nr:hypothetical protein RclHR1_01200003 [Rhizophagus clarus]